MSFGALHRMARKLSADEKIEFAYNLLESVEDDPDYEQLVMEEIKRRYREIEEGRAVFIPAEEVFAELRADLDSMEPKPEVREETVVARPLEEIERDALQLPDDERLDLAYAILRDLEDEGLKVDWDRQEVVGRSRESPI
jgi:putative addiction module component (TIGR02574 family)